jgi:hypothetical protein
MEKNAWLTRIDQLLCHGEVRKVVGLLLFFFVFLVGVAAACLVLFLASPGMSTSSQGSSD